MVKELQKTLENELKIEAKLVSGLAQKLFENESDGINAEKIREFQRNSHTISQNEERLLKISNATKEKGEISANLKENASKILQNEKDKTTALGDLAEAIFESEEVFENVISSVSSTENNSIFSEYSMKKQEMHNIQAEINSVSEQAQSSGILNKLGLNLKLMGFRRNLAMAQKSFSQFKLTATAQLFDSGSFMHNSEFHGNVATKVEAFSQQCRITADLTEEKNSLSAKLADCDAQLNILLEGVPAIAKTHSLKKEINDCKEILKNLLGTEGIIYVQNLIDEEGVLSKKAKSDKFFSDLEQIAAQKQKIASLKRQILIENHTAEVEAASKKIENLNKSISENTNRIKYLTEENADFALKITSLEESIKVFNSQIAKLQAKEKEAKSKNGKKSS